MHLHPPRLTSIAVQAPLILASLISLAPMARAQYVSFQGLQQDCQFSTAPSVSFDTPTASIANNFNYIVEVANSQIGVYQRNGSASWRNYLGGDPRPGGGCTVNTDSFFGSNPLGLGATRIVDTKVLYDDFTDRFCVIGMQQDSAFASGSQGLFVAWSNSDNPLPSACGGGWNIWRTPVPVPVTPAISTYQPDFNGMGQSETHIIYTGVLQPLSNPNAPSYTFYRYFRKSDLNQSPAVLPYRDILVERPTSEFAHAADVFDSGTNMYLASTLINSNALRLTVVNLGNDSEINTILTVPDFAPPTGGAPQPSAGAVPSFLDTIDGRMQSAVVRNNQLYCCHTIARYDGVQRNVVRWYQIALNTWPMVGGTPTIVQSGDIDLGADVTGAPINTCMPSIAVNIENDVVICYSRSSLGENPSVAWSARRSYDPLGTLPLDGIARTGTSSYTASNGTGQANVERWGDWSSAVLDKARFGGFLINGAYADFGSIPCATTLPDHWETWIQSLDPIGAQVTQYGFGFPGTNGDIPTVSVGFYPRVGWSPPVIVSNPSNVPTLGLALIGVQGIDPNQVVTTPFGTPLWVDPAQMVTTTIDFDMSSGQFPLNIPYDLSFVGNSLFLQAAVIDSGAAQGFAASAGIEVRVGV